MRGKSHCSKCNKWVPTQKDGKCSKCGSYAFATRTITNPEEVRKLLKVREEFKDFEEQIINMIAKSGALLEGDFIIDEDD